MTHQKETNIPEIFELIAERPDPQLRIDEYICPFCKSGQNVEVKDTVSTNEGGIGDGDFSHEWNKCICNDCDKAFTQEHKSHNTWYTYTSGDIHRRVILGLPLCLSCFNHYTYTCVHCKGLVRQLKIHKDGFTVTFECSDCHTSAEWHLNDLDWI